MSSTYSTDLRLELIGTGDQAGVWGSTTNNTLGTLMEAAIAGYTSVAIIASPQALTALDGATDQARFNSIALTTTTGANFVVCTPPTPKLYTFYNTTAYTATITNATAKNGTTPTGGTTVIIPAGKTMSVWTDGTNVAQKSDHFIQPTLASPTMTTPVLGTPASGTLTNAIGLPIATGVSGLGTGVATALAVSVGSAGAPVVNGGALGTPASGTLTNATGLPLTTGVTGTLPVANGGTGATSITSGALIKGAGTGAFTAASAAEIVAQIGSTAVANATSAANGGVTSVDSTTGAVTLSSLAAFARSLGTNGYQKFPGGFIIQWGTFGNIGVGYGTASFPIAFPNVCLGVVGSLNRSAAGDARWPYSWNTSNFLCPTDNCDTFWVAFGY